jgi:hypothetical protein
VDLLEDKAGQNLRPPKARTWACRGHTPGGEGVRQGIGAGVGGRAGMPQARQPGPAFLPGPHPHRGRKGKRRSMSEADYAGLIAAAYQQLHAPVILIWIT